jgi:glycosyltransferase involved in cell wall biosynthesis
MARVVHLIAPAPFGGAESVVRHLCNSLQRAGHDVLVVALGKPPADHPWMAQLRADGLEVVSLAVHPKHLLEERRALRALLVEFKADVVHSHGYKADIAVWLASVSGVRWVSTAHGFTHLDLRTTVYQVIERLVLRRAHGVVAVSAAIGAELIRWGLQPERVHVIRNTPPATESVDRDEARALLDLPTTLPVVAWIGRFSPEKGPDRLPALVRQLRTPCVFALVGDGALRAETLDALASVGGTTTVRWLGARGDIARLMRAFDVLVLTSRSEGMPMVVLEAMASGVPVVSFDVGDVRCAVDATTGWLVPAADEPKMAAAVETALRDVGTHQRKGVAAAARVAADFSTDAWIEAHRRVYEG